MGTKNNPGKFDCYANADPDEEMFTLLGRDPAAGALIALWAIQRFVKGGPDGAYIEKVEEALQSADRADAWARKIHGGEAVNAAITMFEPAFLALTEGLAEHPDGFDYPCHCNECCRYG